MVARVGEEEGAQSNKLRNWENERGRKFKKPKAQTTEKQQETQGLCKNPPISTRRVATTHVAPPLRIKYGAKSQGSVTNRKPFIFYGHHDTSQRPQNPGHLMGLMKLTMDEIMRNDETRLQKKSSTSAYTTDEDIWTIQCHQ